jgi:hypothetical protein
MTSLLEIRRNEVCSKVSKDLAGYLISDLWSFIQNKTFLHEIVHTASKKNTQETLNVIIKVAFPERNNTDFLLGAVVPVYKELRAQSRRS